MIAQFIALRPAGGFQLIMADPPWSYEMFSEAGHEKSPHAKYACLGLDALKAMPVEVLAARDALLWLWTVNPMLPQALDLIAAWGFSFSTAGHWVKRTKTGKLGFGTGYVLRNAGEPFLIGRRGNPVTTRGVRSVIEGPLREHSRKPDEAFAAAEKLMPEARRLELFSRQSRPGWTSWGAEAGLFDETVT